MIAPNLRQYCSEDYNLINIADFNSLIAQSQTHTTPVFLLTQEQIEQSGKVWANMKKAVMILMIRLVTLQSVLSKLLNRYQKGITPHFKSRKVRCLCGFPALCLLFELLGG